MSNPPPATSRPNVPPGLFQPGEVIAGKYAIERVIGMGGMGVVLAARHIELDEPVAIKMLLPHLPASGEPAARFLREAKAAIKIKSDHVVRVLDVGRTEAGSPYIVMEYLEGCDLGQLVERRGRLGVEDVVEYVMQACAAIAAAHGLGIVHRDLKPANLFLAKGSDGTPCVKVLDFGISKIGAGGGTGGHSSGLTSTSTIMGTPCFMSPEQLRSTRDVDGRADIWSIGAILHALLTGEPPYDGESNADVSAKIIRDAPTPLRTIRPEVPAALEAIVLRCLEKEPARRFQDVAALAQALAEVTPRVSSKTAAERVVRISAGAAPTLPSLPDPDEPRTGTQRLQAIHSVPGASPLGAPSDGPTRTASAWGETRREEKRGRRIAGIVAAAGIVLGAAVFGLLRLRADASSAGHAPAVTATVTTTAAAPTPPAPEPSATGAAATAPATAAPAEPSPAGSTAAATTKPAVRPPPASTVKVAPGVTAASRPAPSATATSKPGEGLFNGRE